MALGGASSAFFPESQLSEPAVNLELVPNCQSGCGWLVLRAEHTYVDLSGCVPFCDL